MARNLGEYSDKPHPNCRVRRTGRLESKDAEPADRQGCRPCLLPGPRSAVHDLPWRIRPTSRRRLPPEAGAVGSPRAAGLPGPNAYCREILGVLSWDLRGRGYTESDRPLSMSEAPTGFAPGILVRLPVQGRLPTGDDCCQPVTGINGRAGDPRAANPAELRLPWEPAGRSNPHLANEPTSWL